MGLRKWIEKAAENKMTLLGVGPVSENAVTCALDVSRATGAPVIFLASRNQVETPSVGKGYVKDWAPADMVKFVQKHGDGAVYFFERDHGGPWQRDEERNPHLPEKEAFDRALASYFADVEAGFHLLHIDPTRRKNTTPEQVVDDTEFLIGKIEDRRNQASLPPVEYEIGTEENYAGVMSEEKYRWFIKELVRRLEEKKLPRPLFVVGQTGSLVKMDYNAGRFSPSGSAKLALVAAESGIGFKEHNTDYLDEYFLRLHPLCHITSANVAPEFGVIESRCLLKLAAEEGILEARGSVKTPSGFGEAFIRKAMESGKWKKWLDRDIREIDPANDYWRYRLTAVCGHYVFDDPEVAKKRALMMRNVTARLPDPEEGIREEIRQSIRKYISNFSGR